MGTISAESFIAAQAILIWYFFNGATVILNRYLFVDPFGFRFPLSLTWMHMFTGLTLSALCLKAKIVNIEMLPMKMKVYTKERIIFALLFSGNIILGNIALRFIPVSFMQTVKSSVPFFVTLFSYLLFRVRYTQQTILSLFPVVLGVVMASMNELSFDLRGFAAVVTACFVQALQVVYASRLLSDSSPASAAVPGEEDPKVKDESEKEVQISTEKLDVFNTVILVAPPAIVFLTPLILSSEILPLIHWFQVSQWWQVGVVAISCITAFLLNLSTFWLLKVVSGVTYSVAGNFKVVVVIIVSVMIFRNPVSVQSGIGCAITVAGCFWYASIKQRTVN